MLKKIAKILSALLLSATLLVASACSFFAEEERREIENIYYRAAAQDGKEGIMVIIDYVGDEYPDNMFFLPNGEEGKEGNGISDVNAELIDGGARIKITVNYTDKTRDPSVFTFENSVFPTDFTCELDEETGEYNVSITLSNGHTKEFTLHNGVDGDSIVRIEPGVDDEGNQCIVIYMSATDENGDQVVYKIALPEGAKGEPGVGIREIRVDDYLTKSDPSYIYLVIELTDGTELTTTIPKVNNWTKGTAEPSSNAGNIGDFYFDETHYKLYYKDTTGWDVIMDLSDMQTGTYTVFFMKSDGTRDWTVTDIKHGSYFYGSGKEIPLPSETPEGYTFDGWYTKINEDGTVDVNSGRFTDLTPVLSNLYLYPHFIPNQA